MSITVGLFQDIPIQSPRMDYWQTPGRSQRTWWEIVDWKEKIMMLTWWKSLYSEYTQSLLTCDW